jgi:DNA-binding MarR family transcriptional regulator
VTRILLPLEKIGLVTKETNERDARVSYVVLTKTGQQLFEDAKETANSLAKEIIPTEKAKNINTPLSDILTELGGNIN